VLKFKFRQEIGLEAAMDKEHLVKYVLQLSSSGPTEADGEIQDRDGERRRDQYRLIESCYVLAGNAVVTELLIGNQHGVTISSCCTVMLPLVVSPQHTAR